MAAGEEKQGKIKAEPFGWKEQRLPLLDMKQVKRSLRTVQLKVTGAGSLYHTLGQSKLVQTLRQARPQFSWKLVNAVVAGTVFVGYVGWCYSLWTRHDSTHVQDSALTQESAHNSEGRTY